MADAEPMTLRGTTYNVLLIEGPQVFVEPEVFRAYVLDCMDAHDGLCRVLEYNCDEELLEPYAQAVSVRTAFAVDDAAAKTALRLQNERMIVSDIAERVGCEIAFALANYLQVGCSERVREIATQDVRRATQVEMPSSAGQSGSSRSRSQGESVQSQADDTQARTKNGASSQSAHDAPVYKQPPQNVVAKNTALSVRDKIALCTPLPDDPAERMRRIEREGIAMAWHKWVIWFSCWCSAAACAWTAIGGSSLLNTTLLTHSSDALSWARFGVLVRGVSTLLFVVVRSRLSRFRKHAPAQFIFLRMVNAWVIALVDARLTKFLGESPFAGFGTLSLQLGLIVVFVSAVYYNKRAALFDR